MSQARALAHRLALALDELVDFDDEPLCADIVNREDIKSSDTGYIEVKLVDGTDLTIVIEER